MRGLWARTSWGRTGSFALLVLLGLVIFWPALRSQFALDDYVHASMVRGTYPAPRAPYDLYNLVDDASRPTLLARGLLPWWTQKNLVIRFFRPLASVLRWADYETLGSSPFAQHAHSFLWWLAVVLGAGALSRRLLPTRAAAIATLSFALAPCQSVSLTWLANRSALVSLAFGLPGLLAYVRWREERSLRQAVLAFSCFALALAAGEYALAFTGYVLAFELFRRGEAFSRRVLAGLVFVVPTFGYLTLRALLGYGTVGSGYYADPLHDTAAFLSVAPARLVTLWLDAWFALDPDTLGASTPRWVLAGAAFGGLVVVSLVVRSTFALLDEEARRRGRWLLLGSTLSFAPMLAAVPSARLLGVSLFGIAAVVGLALERAWWSSAPQPHGGLHGLASFAVLALAFAQLVHGPATSWLMARGHRESGDHHAHHQGELRARVADLGSAELVVVRADAREPFFLPFALDPESALPLSFSVLSQTGHVLVLRRGARTLELIAPQHESLLPSGEANLFAGMRREFHVGEVFVLPRARATVVEVARGRPRIVTFEFDHDLDASPLLWVSETDHGFVDARPPGIGMGMPLGS